MVAVSIVVVALVGSWLALSRSGILAGWIAPTAPAPDVIATYDGGQITVADLEAHMSLILPEHPSGSGHLPDEVLMVVGQSGHRISYYRDFTSQRSCTTSP